MWQCWQFRLNVTIFQPTISKKQSQVWKWNPLCSLLQSPPACSSIWRTRSSREGSLWCLSAKWNTTPRWCPPPSGWEMTTSFPTTRGRRQIFSSLEWHCCSDGAAAFIGDLFVSFRFVLGSDSLMITEVTVSDEGMYTCIVNTTLDHVSASAELTVVGKFRFLSEHWAAAHCSWSAPQLQPASIQPDGDWNLRAAGDF